jgi:predicted PurR-regulated permease PerM
MSGTVAVALAVLVGTAALGAVGVVVQRGLAQLTERLDQLVRHPPDVQRDLDQFWADLQDAESRRATAVDERLLSLEAALTQTQQKQGQVVQAVRWMLPRVQRWSDEEKER